MRRRSASRPGLALALTLLGALALASLPLPGALVVFKPPWVALALIYWALSAPQLATFAAAFVSGLALDTLTGSLLGQHALALLAVVYVVRKFYLQLRAFPVSQLTLVVLVLLGLYEFVLFWIDGVAGRTVPGIERWAPVSSGTLAWLVIWSLLGQGERRATSRL